MKLAMIGLGRMGAAKGVVGTESVAALVGELSPSRLER